ncbi:MAG: leucyl aminopeptidase family protein, partial [Dokdonella sp.]
MDAWISAADATRSIPLVAIDGKNFDAIIARFGEGARALCAANDFKGEGGRFLGLAASQDSGPVMLAGCAANSGLYALASLPRRLPPGNYALD